MIDYHRSQAQRDMLRLWLDDGDEVATTLPRPAIAGRMALAAWDGATSEIDSLFGILFGRTVAEDDEEPAALIHAASAGGSLARYLTDDAATRILTALGGLPIGAILAVRALSHEIGARQRDSG